MSNDLQHFDRGSDWLPNNLHLLVLALIYRSSLGGSERFGINRTKIPKQAPITPSHPNSPCPHLIPSPVSLKTSSNLLSLYYSDRRGREHSFNQSTIECMIGFILCSYDGDNYRA